MDIAAFFLVVESSRRQARDTRWASEIALSARLCALSDSELMAFQSMYLELVGELEQVEGGGKSLHELVYELWGGCSEEVLRGFCDWVLWRGRETYEALCADPLAFLRHRPVDCYLQGLERPLMEELARRAAGAVPAEPDEALWDLRLLAEVRLEQGDLPLSWLEHADPYVRVLARLSHPPRPDPELFDAPWPERAAIYLAFPREQDLEPLTALLWLDDRAPRRELAPTLRELFAPALARALVPYQEVLQALQSEDVSPEADAQAQTIVQALLARSPDPFAGAPSAELARALCRVASPGWPAPVLRHLARQTHPLAAAVIAGLAARVELPDMALMAGYLRGSAPGGHLALARHHEGLLWHESQLWERLRETLDTPEAQLACRLDALERGARVSHADPLAVPWLLLLNDAVPALREDALTRTVVRWMLCSTRWIDGLLPNLQRVSSLLREVAVKAAVGGRLRAPLEPLEAELLRELEREPSEAVRQVYADWCTQRGVVPRALALQLALRDALSGEGVLSPLDAALALGRLGDATGLRVLLQAPPERRAEAMEVLAELEETAALAGS